MEKDNIMEDALGQVIRQDLSEVFGPRYLNYAVSVIMDRALANTVDGLKPVQRRILYAMAELGLFSSTPYKKSSRVVGEVLGKYHPHGDQSVYDAMVKLAQEFNMRYPLLDGHGNWGSVDGDGAAAMRYTECRLSKIGEQLLNDLKKNTVDFQDNYDGEEIEPVVLPTLLPILLMNGCKGIAVGMKSEIPPHNLKDIYRACYLLIDNTKAGIETNIDDLIKAIPAPDFPTGGTIIGTKGIKELYRTGKGKVVIRSKYHIEETKKSQLIVIDEFPFKANKQTFCTNLAKLVADKKIEGISDIIDESDRNGIRVVIHVKKDENPDIIINNLIKTSALAFQVSNSYQMLSINEKTPITYNIKEMLESFLAHAASVIMRRVSFEQEKAIARLNLVEGVIKCVGNEEELDTVIDIIRHSDTPEEDMYSRGYNKEQTEYILEMKLRRLTKLSKDKFLLEKDEILQSINEYNNILTDNNVLLDTIKAEFKVLENKFGDERRTDIQENVQEIDDEDLVKEETLIITYTTDGIIKAVEEGEYKSQRRGGKGVKATNTKDDEIIKFMFTSNSRDDLLFFTTEGRCHILKAYKIGKSSKAAKGKSINNYLDLNPGEKIISVLNTNIKDKSNDLLFITRKGQIKRLSLEQLSTRYNVTRVISFKEDDSLVQALLVAEGDNVLIATSLGMSLRIEIKVDSKKPIRATGRSAAGVTGINVSENDEVVDMCLVKDDDDILTITENGLGKRTKASEWKIINRGGKGVTCHGLSEKTGKLISIMTCSEDDELFIATEQGLITRIKVDSIRKCGRAASGVKAINLTNDKVASVSINKNQEEEEDE